MSDRKKNTKSKLPIIFGIIFASVAVILRLAGKSPYEFLHKINGEGLFSRFWLFTLLYITYFFVLGYYLGRVIDGIDRDRCACDKTEVYKGGIIFTVLFFMSLFWYPALFARESVILGFFIALICFLASLALLSIWGRISRGTIIFGILVLLWWVYVTILNFLLIFRL